MKNFFILEGAYIVIGIFILLITVYVTTRPFMGKNAPKIGISSVLFFLILLIGGHYAITSSRIDTVKKAFDSGKQILCENRIYTKAAQFIQVEKSNEWSIKDDDFVSPNYTRRFHLARCIVK